MKQRYHKLLYLFALLLSAAWGRVQAQILFMPGMTYTQNFNTYNGSGAASLPYGWTATGAFSWRGQGTGTNNSGGAWAYGTAGDYSLGYLGSGSSPNIAYNASFTNNTGAVITQLVISYKYEQWRYAGGNTIGWTVTGTGALSTAVLSGLNSASALTGTSGVVTTTPKSITLAGLNIAAGATFGIRWACADGGGSDNGNAIDDFQMYSCTPSPPTVKDTTLCYGIPFSWNGNIYTTPQTLTHTFANSSGCDSMVTIHLNYHPQITHTVADTVCFGQSRTWGTQTLTATGTYNQTFTASVNCDSVVTMNFFVRPQITHTVADTVCFGQSRTWGTQTLTATGTYNQTFTASVNCDSVVTMNFFVRPQITHTVADTVCFGQSRTWGTQTLTATGTYTQTFTAASVNCDSVVTMNFFVRSQITHTVADTVCFGQSRTWGTQTLTATGTYTQTFTAASVNCDSVVTMNFFVRPQITHTVADTVCFGQSRTWGTQTLTATGTYNQTFTASVNCDSVVTMNFFVRPQITHTVADTVCFGQSRTWGTQTLTATGTYNQTFTASVNCDSVVTMNFFVRPQITHTVADTVCFGQSHTWGTQTLTATGTYTQTFTAVAVNCDSVVTMNFFVRPQITHTVADTVCFGQSRTWGTQTLTATGTYNQAFTASVNCDSVVTMNFFVRPQIIKIVADTVCFGQSRTWGTQTLTATGTYNQAFTASVNCDSIVTMNFFVRPQITHTVADTVCFGQSRTWGTQTLTATGTYTQTFTAVAVNCDSVVTMNFFVRPQIIHTVADTVCFGQSRTWGTQTLTATGTYTQTFTAVAVNCDSVVTMNFFVRPQITHTVADTVCFGQSHTWGTQTLTATGTYNQAFTASVNCDSVVTMNFFVRPQITHTVADTVCFGQSRTWGTQTLTATGTYTQTFTAALVNCDSVVTMNFFVRPQIIKIVADTICANQTYPWGTQVLTAAGTYTQVFTASVNCDSTVTLNLFVAPQLNSTVADTICFGSTYPWGTQMLSATGTYAQVFTAAAGCDSNVTLHLWVRPQITYTFADTVCFGQSYTWGTQTLMAAGAYTQTFTAAVHCDSMVTLQLYIRPQITHNASRSICYGASYLWGTQTLTAAGVYNQVFTAASGCDSSVTLTLNIAPAPGSLTRDTAACGMVSFEGTQYWTSTTLTDTLVTINGCDSVFRTIHITVYNNTPAQLHIDTAGCGSVMFEGTSYTSSTVLQHMFTNVHGCDSLERTVTVTVVQLQTDTVTATICAGQGYEFHGQYYQAAGTYKASYTGAQGCDSSFVLLLDVNTPPVVAFEAPDQTSYCVGDSIELAMKGNDAYRWVNTFGVDIGTGTANKVYLPDYVNTITVTGTDANGCSDTAAITIKAQACCNLWMPNAFSPNGDGLNDHFKPETTGHPKEYALRIFDRWGTMVFVSYNVADGWDGTFKGKPANIDTYHYRITGKCVNGELLDKRGDLTLVR
ncbi:gliding motility-associated C-terminal domain-containing protein [Taibaiella helva]|uniref:gliding motility-associated C-terminal domain-containing protein n=1 Tax=Taibaiella helva TaxID=2301235 RepID=UPI000E57C238|nr:gliding motility-associated C-terminal domain-containing protein [Taibaiella helva]